MKYEIIDNFIDKDTFEIIKNQIMDSSGFPWYYNAYKVNRDDALKVDYSFQFTHMFYENYETTSQYANILKPIIDNLDPLAIIKIKGNLTTLSPEKNDFGWHTDYKKDEGTFSKYGRTAVFYLNTNNGPTAFDIDGERVEIEAKENRLVTFEPGISHTGCSATDAKARVVLNLNYIPR